MLQGGARGSRRLLGPGQSFARSRNNQHGNNLPADSGMWQPDPNGPGPGPSSQGYVIGGNLGGDDGAWGADPRMPKITRPRFLPGQDPAGLDAGTQNNPGPWRGGLQGFNDKLTVKDRHAYWDQGRPQRQGTDFSPASSPPNTYNNPLQEPPRADLRTVNRTVSYQKGTDTTRNQDDLSRGYSWLGEQGSGWSPIYGGEPGYYLPYGSRGGVPYPAVSPSGGARGRGVIWAGPPHGLHSLTYPAVADTLARNLQLPQMRPVRIDRPSNSPQAGQSYSQTVLPQGAARDATITGGAGRGPVGWTGRA